MFLYFFVLIRRASKVGMMVYVLAFSLLFAYCANAEWAVLLPLTGGVAWYGTRWMKEKRDGARRWAMWMMVVVELLPLLYFKYSGAGVELLNEIWHQNLSLRSIAMPVGISFYTFQAVSYTVDVYKGKWDGRENLLEYLFYLCFFPLLLAGPITRAETFFPQVQRMKGTRVNRRLVESGVWLVMLGLVKKSVMADYIAQYNNWIFDDPMGYSGFEVLMGAIGYTVQIYCDFSGYSDMSIGIAALMGIELKENFRFPYQSCSVGEFWHRWHISLSTWFRDYVYIPMGGNRKGKVRTYLNNMVTMLVAGLWHGSTMMFVVWGAMHGLGLLVQKSMKGVTDRVPRCWASVAVYWLMTHVFVACAWVVFRSPNMDVCRDIFWQIGWNMDWAYAYHFVVARPMWVAVVVVAYMCQAIRERHYYRLQEWYVDAPWVVKLVMLIVVVQAAIEFSVYNVQAFIYSQF